VTIGPAATAGPAPRVSERVTEAPPRTRRMSRTLLRPLLMLGGILWPLVLLAGFVMAVLLLGLLFGWPLMWAAISAEGTDAFDALSRSYAYVFQRPLNYLFYAFVAGVIGWLGWLFVENFAAAIIWMAYWAAGWGCGNELLNSIQRHVGNGDVIEPEYDVAAIGSVLVPAARRTGQNPGSVVALLAASAVMAESRMPLRKWPVARNSPPTGVFPR